MDRILIVDDDLQNVLLAKAALERAGFEVEATTDPRQVAGLAARGDFDVVVLDW
jgi:DNA-binding response OmpR family regulator